MTALRIFQGMAYALVLVAVISAFAGGRISQCIHGAFVSTATHFAQLSGDSR